MFADEWYITQIQNQADQIRLKMKDMTYMGVKLDKFMIKHPDIAIVCAYTLGSADNSMLWKQGILDKIKDTSDDNT